MKYGNQAGIDPRMVLANSLGLTNMKEAQFDEVKKRYPDEFQGVKWSDVVGNSEVSIKATAYNLTIRNLSNPVRQVRLPVPCRCSPSGVG